MSTVRTQRQVSIEEVREALTSELGSTYRVGADSDSTLRIGRPGVIPAKVTLIRRGGSTTFKIGTTGLILSRIAQLTSINPQVKRALEQVYAEAPPAE